MKKIAFVTLFIFHVCRLFAQEGIPPLAIHHLTDQFYIYTTYNTYNGQQIPAHGMYLLTEKGAVLFDTPWDSTQFQPLLDSIQMKHHQQVIICIATHWHSDRTAGLEYYKSKGIQTFTTVKTDSLCVLNHKKRAEFLMQKDTVMHVGSYDFETYYPGEGHTTDNIVIWFPKQKILYGGCLIKGAEAEDLGFLGDGNKRTYAATLKNVRKKFPNPKFVIVSHHDWHNKNALNHSIELAEQLAKDQQ